MAHCRQGWPVFLHFAPQRFLWWFPFLGISHPLLAN
jgi:hypothetical protein